MPESACIAVPRVYQAFRDAWERERPPLIEAYARGRVSFVPCLLPELALAMTVDETLALLRRRLGELVDLALHPTLPEEPLPVDLRGPVADQADGSWLRSSNVVGVNIRAVGSFWNVVKYALTLPAAQNAIHLLPFWEPGVVGSLYGISSWNLNPEFFSPELAAACPWLDSTEQQLRAMVHLLHAMGKAVGMDVIPHTDRFAEIVLANPACFEWLQREGPHIVDHSDDLHVQVQGCILSFLQQHGPAMAGDPVPATAFELFDGSLPEANRLRLLFGLPGDPQGRVERRIELVRHLHAYGYETVPATMAPPFRGLEVNPETRSVDAAGNVWYEYRLARPQPMSRVFGPLTRFKLYAGARGQDDWQLNFDRPLPEVWRYVCDHYAQVQRRYGFDFMRGDMSHVQMRPGGVPQVVDDYYDLLAAVKRTVRSQGGTPHFAYLAETFLAARNVMVYGDEADHLDASDADVTLGDLQSTSVGSPAFLQKLAQYRGILDTRRVAPCFTLMTGDKDDPRFDEFYLKGNSVRLFLALFLTDMPSYMALGFELRDANYRPAPNEHYTKFYVFQDQGGAKATHGPYVWGRNGPLFHTLTRLRLYADEVLPRLTGRTVRWLIHPDPAGDASHLAWTQADCPERVFLANCSTAVAVEGFHIPPIPGAAPGSRMEIEFSTAGPVPDGDRRLVAGKAGYRIARLEPEEARAYRITGGR